MEPYMECFRDVFGFYPKEYEQDLAQQFQTKRHTQTYQLPHRVCYPENWYVPRSKFEKAMDNISDWKTIRYSPYKRISHFREHLNRLQYCQFVTIPDEVHKMVQESLRPIQHVKQTIHKNVYFMVKELLKNKGCSVYNEHIHYLISATTNIFITISYEDRSLMCTLFIQLEHAFKHRARKLGYQIDSLENRKNIFSYYLIIQLMLYLFHCHPCYHLPTLLDNGKRQQYYLFLLTLLVETPLYNQVIHQHFTRKKMCQACCQHQTFLDEDLTNLL